MYKASYTNGDTWYEWIKMGPHNFRELRIDGDGSHHTVLRCDSLKTVRHSTRMDNNLYATKGGLSKVAHMPEGDQYLNKDDLAKYAPTATAAGKKLPHAEAVAIAESLPF